MYVNSKAFKSFAAKTLCIMFGELTVQLLYLLSRCFWC